MDDVNKSQGGKKRQSIYLIVKAKRSRHISNLPFISKIIKKIVFIQLTQFLTVLKGTSSLDVGLALVKVLNDLNIVLFIYLFLVQL